MRPASVGLPVTITALGSDVAPLAPTALRGRRVARGGGCAGLRAIVHGDGAVASAGACGGDSDRVPFSAGVTGRAELDGAGQAGLAGENSGVRHTRGATDGGVVARQHQLAI